jgi:hypothetical protein
LQASSAYRSDAQLIAKAALLMPLGRILKGYGVKVALALGCFAFIGWLAFDAAPATARRAALDQALRDATIGKLESEESESLMRQLTWLARAVGITDEIALNQPFHTGRLNIYTTTPAAYNVTYCATRNALYDAELDAVFIDEGIFKADDYRSLLEASPYGGMMSLNDLPFQKVYLRFIILHELGHRQLHRNSGHFLDLVKPGHNTTLLRFEAEADQFAIDKLQIAYQRDLQAGGSLVGRGMSDVLDQSEKETSPADRVWIDLVGMVTMMNAFNLFLPNPYAPFYEDRAHLTFLDRATGLINQALNNQGLNQQLRASFAFQRRYRERQHEMLEAPLVEVLAPVPIGSVNFDGQGLVIGAGDMSEILHVPYAQLESRGARQTVALPPTTAGSVHDVTEKSVTWSTPTLGTIMFRDDGHTYLAQVEGWRAQETGVRQVLEGASFPQLAVPPEPAELAFLVAAPNDSRTDHLYVFKGDQLLGKTTLATVTQEFVARGAPVGCGIALNTANLNKVYFTISKPEKGGEDRWFGVAALEPATLQVLHVAALQFPSELQTVSDSRLVVVPNGTSEHFILIKNVTVPGHQGWVAWLLSATEAPQQIAAQSFLSGEIAGSVGPRLDHIFDATLSRAFWLPPEQIVIVSNADSIYVLDVPTRRVRLAFHPGDETLQCSVSANGMMAMYMPGGHKTYVWASPQ